MRLGRPIGIVVYAFVLTVTSGVAFAGNDPTASDKATARSLMEEGRAMRAGGDNKGAAEKFRAADAIMGVPTTGLELGKTQLDLGLLVEATDTLLRVTRIPASPTDPEVFRGARTEAAALVSKHASSIPSLRVVVTGVDRCEPSVTIDGQSVAREVLSVPRKVNPGPRIVVAKVDTVEKKVEVNLDKGQVRDVSIDFTGACPPETKSSAAVAKTDALAPPQKLPEPKGPPAVDTSSGHQVHPLTYIGFGLAGAGLLVGGTTGALAMSKTSTVKGQCEGSRCPPATHSDIDSAKTLGDISTISFVVGGVGAVAGVVGLLWPQSVTVTTSTSGKSSPVSRVGVWVGPSSAGVSGAF